MSHWDQSQMSTIETGTSPPTSKISPWDWSHKAISDNWDQINWVLRLVIIWSQTSKISPRDWSHKAISDIWDQINWVLRWVIIWSQTSKISPWNWSHRVIFYIWDQINWPASLVTIWFVIQDNWQLFASSHHRTVWWCLSLQCWFVIFHRDRVPEARDRVEGGCWYRYLA